MDVFWRVFSGTFFSKLLQNMLLNCFHLICVITKQNVYLIITNNIALSNAN